ncbi:MAG TPA: Gfo/Idh/MocA family oxidoreductase [Phycisphaerae bacterium]|nr:Gfo/Idh/MocA family oxidoreductase [Phycisphaerae bacterium]
MTVSDPRICIVGAGGLSTKRIYPNIGAAGAKLVGVCDLDEGKARRNADRFGGTVYTDMAEMLQAEAPDGVIICIGPDAHAELAKDVLSRGIPVYTEKPPAPDAASALAVARASKQTGVLCTTAFKKRYAAAYTRAREFIESGGAEHHHRSTHSGIDRPVGAYGQAARRGVRADHLYRGLVESLFGGIGREDADGPVRRQHNPSVGRQGDRPDVGVGGPDHPGRAIQDKLGVNLAKLSEVVDVLAGQPRPAPAGGVHAQDEHYRQHHRAGHGDADEHTGLRSTSAFCHTVCPILPNPYALLD